MGNCIQSFLRTRRSQLKQQTLLNHQELCTLIKSSTINDHQFCSSHNLPAVQKFISQYSLNPNMPLDIPFINRNIEILNKFLLQLRDRTTDVGKQALIDQQRIAQYINQQLTKQKIQKDIGNTIKLSAVMLKLEIQTLLLSVIIIQEIQNLDKQWSLLIQIQELPITPGNMKKKGSKNNNQNKIQSNDNNMQNQNKIIIERIWIDDFQKIKPKNQYNSDSPTKLKKSNKTNQIQEQSTNSKVPHESQSQIQQIRLFSFCSKVVNKNSMIKIGLFRVLKKKYLNFIGIENSFNKQAKSADKYQQQRECLKNKILLGQTCLSTSDFIYYNSLVVTDVVSLSAPNLIKSSITTTSSSSSSNSGAFISVRGQGLRAETFENDHIKIIKQHEILIQQMQMCLEGNKGWEKLSEFRNSNGSKKCQSIYSEYSIPQQNNQRYKI